jgi:heme/copper-type cytochrome/quinol oxidase subunit 3
MAATSPMLALESGEKRPDPHLVTTGAVALAIGIVVAFGALLGAWLSLRSGTAVWPPKGVLHQDYYGNTLGITMLMIALTAEWAAYGVRKHERGQAIGAYALVVVLGLGFVNLLTYVAHSAGFGPATHPYGLLWFAFTVLMGATVVVALIATIAALVRFLGGQVTPSEPALARAVAWLWHAAAVGWFIMYAAIYQIN